MKKSPATLSLPLSLSLNIYIYILTNTLEIQELKLQHAFWIQPFHLHLLLSEVFENNAVDAAGGVHALGVGFIYMNYTEKHITAKEARTDFASNMFSIQCNLSVVLLLYHNQ